MKIYRLLSNMPAIKNRFTLKILFVAFVGIHIPLFAIIGYLLISTLEGQGAWTIGILTLVFTLLATAITLWVLNSLLQPVIRSKQALNNYIKYAKLPNLPTNYTDKAGVLMRDVQQAIDTLEKYEERRLSSLQLLSHDLQSPLRTTLGIIDFLKREEDPDLIREHHLLIEESLQSHLAELEALLEDLKEGRKASLEVVGRREMDLDLVLKSLEKRFRPAIVQKGLSLEIENRVQQVQIPEFAIKNSLINILGNAIKYSEPKGKISIRTKIEKERLQIAIKDEGIGFDPEEVNQIFQYDYSLRKIGEEHDKHSHGVGLNLCQALMNKSGGQIKAFSDGPGKGAYLR